MKLPGLSQLVNHEDLRKPVEEAGVFSEEAGRRYHRSCRPDAWPFRPLGMEVSALWARHQGIL